MSPSIFRQELQKTVPKTEPKHWIFIPYDQLNDGFGPLSRAPIGDLGIVLIESRWKASRRLVHKQKLFHVLANMRTFALEQAAKGVPVDYRHSEDDYATVLRAVVAQKGRILMQRAAERELRENLAPLVEEGLLVVRPHEGWLTTPEDFATACEAPPFRMDAFYRQVRRRTGILMEGGKPAGGRFSHDGDNRLPWKGDPPAPEPPRFSPGPVALEVAALVSEHFAEHPGEVDPGGIPTTRADAEALWQWAKQHCLESFGPYEDAMSTASRSLFHTRISPVLNQHRLLPSILLNEVLELDLPLNSTEGFVRQVLGWREFVRHVHEVSDGFRREGMRPDQLTANTPLPAAWWGAESGLACLDEVVEGVWQEAWSHHIPRLMVLSNIALLLDVSPRELTDWFWVAYADAYDWVVEPNVLGMGTFATGELMTTKPYVAGSGYIHRMSDYCKTCQFHPKKSCPLTPMYWAWLDRHDAETSHVQRLTRQLWSSRKRAPEKKAMDAEVFQWVSDTLGRGERLAAQDSPQARSTP